MCGMGLDGICSFDISDSWWRRHSAFSRWNLLARGLRLLRWHWSQLMSRQPWECGRDHSLNKHTKVWSELSRGSRVGLLKPNGFHFNLIMTDLLLPCNSQWPVCNSGCFNFCLCLLLTLRFLDYQLVKADKRLQELGSALRFVLHGSFYLATVTLTWGAQLVFLWLQKWPPRTFFTHAQVLIEMIVVQNSDFILFFFYFIYFQEFKLR